MSSENNKKSTALSEEEYSAGKSPSEFKKPVIITGILLAASVILLIAAFILIFNNNAAEEPASVSADMETYPAVSSIITETTTASATTSTTTVITTTTTTTTKTTTVTTTVTTKANIDASRYIGFWHKRNMGTDRELTISSVNGNKIIFTLWYYRLASIDNILAELDGNTAYFKTDDIEGYMLFCGDTIEFCITYSVVSFMPEEHLTFNARHDHSWYMDGFETKPPFESYVIQVSNPNLPIYAEPSYYSSVTGYITDQSYYTIVDEEGSWGMLKSGLGWINLIDASYTFEGGIADDGREEGEEEEFLIGIYCSSCQQKFHVSSFDSVYICPFCGHDCTYE